MDISKFPLAVDFLLSSHPPNPDYFGRILLTGVSMAVALHGIRLMLFPKRYLEKMERKLERLEDSNIGFPKNPRRDNQISSLRGTVRGPNPIRGLKIDGGLFVACSLTLAIALWWSAFHELFAK